MNVKSSVNKFFRNTVMTLFLAVILGILLVGCIIYLVTPTDQNLSEWLEGILDDLNQII